MKKQSVCYIILFLLVLNAATPLVMAQQTGSNSPIVLKNRRSDAMVASPQLQQSGANNSQMGGQPMHTQSLFGDIGDAFGSVIDGAGKLIKDAVEAGASFFEGGNILVGIL